MADQTTQALSDLATLAAADSFPIVDASDTTDGASGTVKETTLTILSAYLAALTQTLINKTLTSPTITSPVINTGVSGTAISTDGTLADNSDTLLSSQKAVKTYVDANRVKLVDSSSVDTVLTESTASAINEVTVKNAATGGVPIIKSTGDDTNIHLKLDAKGSAFVKVKVLRQDSTTNAYQGDSVVLTGWSKKTGDNTQSMSGTGVTFGITFSAYPIVVACYAGTKTTGATDPTGTSAQGWIIMEVGGIATTGFSTYFTRSRKGDGTDAGAFSTGLDFITTWIAIGVLA